MPTRLDHQRSWLFTLDIQPAKKQAKRAAQTRRRAYSPQHSFKRWPRRRMEKEKWTTKRVRSNGEQWTRSHYQRAESGPNEEAFPILQGGRRSSKLLPKRISELPQLSVCLCCVPPSKWESSWWLSCPQGPVTCLFGHSLLIKRSHICSKCRDYCTSLRDSGF